MSKTNQDREFRKVDVDKYDEDYYQEDGGEMTDFSEASKVNSLLGSSDYLGALKTILGSQVLTGSSIEGKKKMVQTFSQLVSCVKSNQVDDIFGKLNEEQLNQVMKVIYCTFALKSDGDFSSVHAWHEKLYSIIGVGGILRVLTDRKAAKTL